VALTEHTVHDKTNCRMITNNMADYSVPVNADVSQIQEVSAINQIRKLARREQEVLKKATVWNKPVRFHTPSGMWDLMEHINPEPPEQFFGRASHPMSIAQQSLLGVRSRSSGSARTIIKHTKTTDK